MREKTFYFPLRFVFVVGFLFAELLTILICVVALVYYVPYFYIVIVVLQVGTAIAIINSHENPDYKVPWLFFVMLIPVVGVIAYFIFYRRNIRAHEMKRIKETKAPLQVDDGKVLEQCKNIDERHYAQALCAKKLAQTHLYKNTDIKYFKSGEDFCFALLKDLKRAKKFIIIDYFIIEKGFFWNEVLDILKEKAKTLEVKIVYDDFGCMTRLPAYYYLELKKYGIDAVPFGLLRGQARGEFNNRNHRKITIVDGKVAYTGGINIADAYINKTHKLGYWKDVGVRLEGEAVCELTRLALLDYSFSKKRNQTTFQKYYPKHSVKNEGFCMPFGDGPRPIYAREVSKTLILNIINQATKYVYITTPYLIIDDELVQALENAVLRNVDVRIITPHIPDKKIVFAITRSFYDTLVKSGVKIFEYKPGFLHAKIYLSDDATAIVGTINLDHRSLVHHFENGVWIYRHSVLNDIKKDFLKINERAVQYKFGSIKKNIVSRFTISLINIFSTLF